jgi:cellulose synthase/poly-beta-1,6-N-acetylglucosamine synthase-like glycosyltransferase
MHPIIVSSILVITLSYGIFVLSLLIGLRRLPAGSNSLKYSVSIVVAVRNEERSLRPCIEALLAQDYPRDLLEIIMVDDRSEDTTRSVIEEYTEKNDTLKCVSVQEVPAHFSPKKFALTKGIQAASGEIICTTDADCVPPVTWVAALVAHFTGDTGFVAGFSPVHTIMSGDSDETSILPIRLFRSIYDRWMADFLLMDSIGLAVASAGGISLGMPWTCAGRNLAYRKKVFEEVGGFEDVKHSVSGDDDLLMFLIHEKTNWKLRFAQGKSAAVPTYDDTDVRRIAHQRMRHSSKFFIHPFRVKIASMVVFLFYCLFMLFPFYVIATGNYAGMYLLIAGSKVVFEYSSTRSGARRFGAEFSCTAFLKAYFFHPPVTVLASIFGSTGRFKWKGRGNDGTMDQ